MTFNVTELSEDCKIFYERVREEFSIAAHIGNRTDIDSAMMNVDILLSAYAKSLKSPKNVKNVKKVYHVENPTIAGEIVEENIVNDLSTDKYVEVVFDENVGFSGNPGRFSRNWTCNSNLLYKTPHLAFKNSRAAKR